MKTHHSKEYPAGRWCISSAPDDTWGFKYEQILICYPAQQITYYLLFIMEKETTDVANAISQVTLRHMFRLPVFKDGKRVEYAHAEYEMTITGSDRALAEQEFEAEFEKVMTHYNQNYITTTKKVVAETNVPATTISASQLDFLKKLVLEETSVKSIVDLAPCVGYEKTRDSIIKVVGQVRFDEIRNKIINK